MTIQIADRWVVITGASGGIGAEFARQFHALGARVCLVARRADNLASMADGFNRVRPDSARTFVVDLSDKKAASWEALLNFIDSNEIEILVNNAGRGSFGFFETISLEQEHEMVALNISATLTLSHRVIPQLKRRRRGAIISISSIAAMQPIPYMATYAATKAFNLTHSLGLRYELSRFNVKVLTVCPGPVETGFGGVARVPGRMTGVRRDSVEDVVRESLYALDKNYSFVVPCLRPKLMWMAINLLPRAISTWITERSLRGTLEHVTRS